MERVKTLLDCLSSALARLKLTSIRKKTKSPIDKEKSDVKTIT